MPGRTARVAVGLLVAATSIGCTTKAVELPSEAPTSTVAPAPVPPETTTSSTRPPVRPIHPAVASPPVVARIAPSGPVGADPGNVAIWDRLASCESGGNWADRDSPTYRGGLQFSYSTWASVGGSGDPADASKAEQISRARALQARSGWSPWPACSRHLGYR